MAEKTMDTRLKIRGDTASNWSSVNPTLLKNEIGYDETNKRFKIGDGTTPWNSLSYIESDSVNLEPIKISGSIDWVNGGSTLEFTEENYQQFLKNKTAPVVIDNAIYTLYNVDEGGGEYYYTYERIVLTADSKEIHKLSIGWNPIDYGYSDEHYIQEIGSSVNLEPINTDGIFTGWEEDFGIEITLTDENYQQFLKNKLAPIRIDTQIFQLETLSHDGNNGYCAQYYVISGTYKYAFSINWEEGDSYCEEIFYEYVSTQVSYTPTLTEGTKIGAITIDGVETNIYAPEGSGGSVNLEPIKLAGSITGWDKNFSVDITLTDENYQQFLKNKTAPIQIEDKIFQLYERYGQDEFVYYNISENAKYFIWVLWLFNDCSSIEDFWYERINGSVKITYNELKNLRDSRQLVPGMQYQITDYQCTTTQQYTRSAYHQFDIIVTADSESTLNENARATYNDNDNYFSQTLEKTLYDTSSCSFLGTEEDINITVFGYQYEYDDANIDDIVEDYLEGEIQGDSGTDVFMAVDYKVNPHGFNSPVIYKTDYDQDSEADYGDEFWYVGKYDIDGITYDRWLKKELDDVDNTYNFTDGKIRKYVLTNELVDNDVILTEGSSRVFNVNMNAWELKYCLDNDNSRFAWAAVATSGRGVIYYMKDEYGNECPYDFKNIMFERVKNTISDPRLLYGGRYIHPIDGISWSQNSSFAGSNKVSDSKFFYTFSNYNSDDETVTDLSVIPFTLLEGESGLGAYGSKEILKPENNKIEKTTVTTITDSNVAEKVQSLNDIVFVLHSSIMVSVIPKNNFWIKLFRNNIIKENCSEITIYDFAIDNTIGYGNRGVVIGFFSNNNKLGVGNTNIGIFGSDNNTIECSCDEVFIYTRANNTGTDGTKLNLINNIKFMNVCQNITLWKGNFVRFENATILANSHDYYDVPMNVSIDSKFYLEDDTSPLSEYYEFYTEG